MEIITDTKDFWLTEKTAVAMGKFDGIHIGHRRLLEEILQKKSLGLAACVFTFEPAPAVLFGQSDGRELTTREEKRLFLERMGVDILIEFPLNKKTAAIAPGAFVKEVLAGQMQTAYVAAGKDLSFGAKGAGNAALLTELGRELGFAVQTIEKVCYCGKEVSSSRIRELLEAGQMELVENMLGMPYTIVGQVAHGSRIGRTLGFPTVNLLPGVNKLLPPKGVYFSRVRHDGKIYRAITNIGYKPTVSREQVYGVETYIYDFDKDIYGQTVEVLLKSFRRPERQFADLDELKNQLQEDIAAGREVKVM